MTQDAIVVKLLPHDMAEVAVTRSTACGGNCGSCEACIFQSELRAVARNRIGARPGQRVVIESRTATVFKAAALVYVMPLVLFFLGYGLAAALGAGEGLCILVSFLALALGAGLMMLTQRRAREKDKISFDIIG